MQYVGWLLYMLLQIYFWILMARMIISWIPLLAPRWRPRGFVASLFEIAYTLTDPPIKLFRKIIPPLNLGGVSLDIAFMAVLIALIVLQRVVIAIFW
ncbi:YggT family protein [Propionimicrobium sp. PCR01-08-3]|uniref:YggT family protein n=1 Tax=Propionimicrobium sp. PCR01-08-3 TaxID=3052086 RepID=UPI00255D10D9|nr:YggT family protein [Propionimicrobium sp. PCR01-08-3]WIY81641.1 YggT family protein [Propionimicrobium sp. PCR01-08-3]